MASKTQVFLVWHPNRHSAGIWAGTGLRKMCSSLVGQVRRLSDIPYTVCTNPVEVRVVSPRKLPHSVGGVAEDLILFHCELCRDAPFRMREWGVVWGHSTKFLSVHPVSGPTGNCHILTMAARPTHRSTRNVVKLCMPPFLFTLQRQTPGPTGNCPMLATAARWTHWSIRNVVKPSVCVVVA